MDLLDRRRLDQLSHELSDGAGQVRSLMAGIRGLAGSMRWRSPASRAAADSLAQLLDAGLRLAAGLEDTAAALSAHSRRAADLAARATGLAHHGAELAHQGVRLAERLARR